MTSTTTPVQTPNTSALTSPSCQTVAADEAQASLIPEGARAALLTRNDDGSDRIQPVPLDASILNIERDLREHMKHSLRDYLLQCAKHGGQWTVTHAKDGPPSNPAPDGYAVVPIFHYYPTKDDATAAREKFLAAFKVEYPKFPDRMMRVVQQPTLEEARARLRRTKHVNRFNVDFYSIVGGVSDLVSTEELSPWFISKFAAARALRKIQKTYPAARLTCYRCLFSKDELIERAGFLRKIVRPGESPMNRTYKSHKQAGNSWRA